MSLMMAMARIIRGRHGAYFYDDGWGANFRLSRSSTIRDDWGPYHLCGSFSHANYGWMYSICKSNASSDLDMLPLNRSFTRADAQYGSSCCRTAE